MVYVFFANGFEETEGITIVDVLRRANIDLKMVGRTDKIISTHGIEVSMDMTLNNISDLDSCQMLILPGGMPGVKNLYEDDKIKDLLIEADQRKILIAAICAAPLVLSKLNLIRNRQITCFPTSAKDILNAQILDDDVVVDGNLITGRGVGVAMLFALKLVEILTSKQISEQLRKSMVLPTDMIE